MGRRILSLSKRTIRARAVAGRTAGIVMSLVVAVVLLVLQNLEYWVGSWQPQSGRAAPVSIRLPAFSVYRIHLGQPAELLRRQVLVGRGTVLEPNEEARLVSAHFSARARGQLGWPLGMFSVTLVAVLLLLAALRRTPGLTRFLRAQVALVALVVALLVGAKAFLLLTPLPAYYFPIPAAVLVTAFLLGRRTAFAVNLFCSAMFASMLGFDPSVFAVVFATGLAGTFLLGKRKKSRAVLVAGGGAGWLGAMTLLALMLVFHGTIHLQDLVHPEESGFIAAFGGGLFSGLLAWLLLGPMAWLLGRVSRAKLLELQDLDHPILKRIREKAPGTWEHSRAMANLAEAAAASIGADSLLVRVGTYVHDAGKALGPELYIENQNALDVPNPHEQMAPDISTECIFDHVTEGVKLLRKHRLPEAVVEFAYTHHGTSLLEFFWVKNMEGGNPDGLTEEDFRYPGMRPTTRETAIVMIVDAVEAASRTIKPPEKTRFEALVRRIVFSKLTQGQLDDCDLSLGELKAVVTTVVDTLVNTYHARIEYPWQRQTEGAVTGTGPVDPLAGAAGTGPVAASVTGTGPVVQPTSAETGPTSTGGPPLLEEPPVELVPQGGAPVPAGGPAGGPETRTLAAAESLASEALAEPAASASPTAVVESPDGFPIRRRRMATHPGIGTGKLMPPGASPPPTGRTDDGSGGGPAAPRRDEATDDGGAAPPGAVALPVSPFPPAEDLGGSVVIAPAPGATPVPRKKTAAQGR